MRLAAVILAALAPALPAAGQSFSIVTYMCDRGISVPVTNVVGPDTDLVVLNVDGRQVTLRAEPSASGVRYSWPTDAPVHVWWTRGDEATLYWKTSAGETPILTCRLP